MNLNSCNLTPSTPTEAQFYLAKKQDSNEGLVLKKLTPGSSAEKVQKIISENRGIKIQTGDNDQVGIKVDEKHFSSLKDKKFTHILIKNASGQHEKHEAPIKIETLTTQESKELNNALNQLLVAVQQKRKQEEEKNKTGEERLDVLPNHNSQKSQLKPSDFSIQNSKNSQLKEAVVMNALIEEGRRTERQRDKNEQAKDDEVTTIRDSVIRTENLKSDLKKRGIQDSELGVEPLNPVMRQKILSKKQTSVRAHRGL